MVNLSDFDFLSHCNIITFGNHIWSMISNNENVADGCLHQQCIAMYCMFPCLTYPQIAGICKMDMQSIHIPLTLDMIVNVCVQSE